MATLPEQLERLEETRHARGRHRPLGARRRRGERDRRRDRARPRRRRGHQGQVARDGRDRPQRGARAARASQAIETDLAELIVQLGDDEPSHILVPAIHRNRAEIAALFERTIAAGQELGLEPAAIAEAARAHLREKFLSVPGGGLAARTSRRRDRHGRRRRVRGQRPHVHDAAEGARHADGDREGAAEWRDLEVMLQLLPRSLDRASG